MDDPNIQTIPDRCLDLIYTLEPVVFSDYRIIYKFAEACQSDIDRLNCGRLSENNDNVGWGVFWVFPLSVVPVFSVFLGSYVVFLHWIIKKHKFG